MKGIVLLLLIALTVSCSSTNKLMNAKQRKAHIYYTQGTQKLLERDYTSALKNLMLAQKLDPENSKILNNLGMAYYFRGRIDLAEKFVLESIEEDKNNSDARNNLASIYFQQRKYKKAQEQYNNVLADLIYSHHYRIYYNLGLIEEKKGKLNLAIKNYEKASGIRVDYCAANYKLAVSYRSIGRIKASKEWFKKSVRGACENNILPFYDWASLLVDLGENQEAIEKLNYIIKKFPQEKLTKIAARKKRIIEKKMALSLNTTSKDSRRGIESGDF